eukprot:764457-Hanusia_phi.AAC.2
MAIVSAASHEYFERLANLVGSVHTWARQVPVVLYDIGLTPRQNQQLHEWINVSVRKLDLSKLPEHVRWTGWEKSTYAFKPIVVREALRDFECILWLDSGEEEEGKGGGEGVSLTSRAGIELRRDITWAFDWLEERKALFLASGMSQRRNQVALPQLLGAPASPEKSGRAKLPGEQVGGERLAAPAA